MVYFKLCCNINSSIKLRAIGCNDVSNSNVFSDCNTIGDPQADTYVCNSNETTKINDKNTIYTCNVASASIAVAASP